MNKKKYWIISLILLIIASICVILLYKTNQKQENKEKQEIIIEKFINFMYDNNLLYFEKLNKEFNKDNISNDIISKYIYHYYQDYFEETDLEYITKEEIDNMIKRIFGNNIKYKHESLYYCEKCQRHHILYNEEEEKYYSNINNHDANKNIMINQLTTSNMEENNNTYIISNKSVYYTAQDNKYKGFYTNYEDAENDKNIVYDISRLKTKEEIEMELDQKYEQIEKHLVEYKYTFKIENENITFESFEIIK